MIQEVAFVIFEFLYNIMTIELPVGFTLAGAMCGYLFLMIGLKLIGKFFATQTDTAVNEKRNQKRLEMKRNAR